MKSNQFNYGTVIIHLFFIICCFLFIVPMIYVISISLSGEGAIEELGYRLIPNPIFLDAYKYILRNPTQLIDSYKVTVFISFFGGFLSLMVMSMVAYPLSLPNFHFKKSLTFFIFFTMLFGGGLIPSYILNTQYLGLDNNIWVYILPSLASAWHIIILRTFFQKLPISLIESAKIDGAKEYRIFFSIIIPLSKPVLATIFLLVLLNKWNDWYNTLIYIRDAKLYTLQYMLQRILREAEFVKSVARDMGSGMNITLDQSVPTEPIRFAMVIVAAGPMLVVFPFFQKYFTQGLTVGAVKG